MNILLYLVAGILTDILITLYYLCVGKLLPYHASLISFISTFFQLGVMYYIIKFDGLLGMAIYSLGCAVGCLATILYLRRRKNSKNLLG